jgi:hypothetical protein
MAHPAAHSAKHMAKAWAASAHLEPHEIDCATALMLKIIDGKCKMNAGEKAVMAVIYDVVRERPGKHLGEADHRLIAQARNSPDEALLARVYERRVLAETMISRPVMKAYKAMLRGVGVLGEMLDEVAY